METNDCLRLALYNQWATRRIAPALSALTDEELDRGLGGSFPSIRATCAHLAGVAELWESRMRGVNPTKFRGVGDFGPGAQGLLEPWFAADDAVVEQFRSCQDPNKVLEVINTEGKRFLDPLAECLQHFVNHQSYHRGQLTTLLRQLGKKPASQDLIAYWRERRT
jgi:uncharacterized damage-inducible protein DinB